MKIKSNLRLKAEDLVDSFYDLLDALHEFIAAILAHPPVKRVLDIAVPIYWGIGFIGFAWVVFSGAGLLFSGFKSADGSVVDWLRDFIVACPWLALIWLFITVTTCWMFLYKGKKQNSEAKV